MAMAGVSNSPDVETPSGTGWRSFVRGASITFLATTFFGFLIGSQWVLATANSPRPVPWLPALVSSCVDTWIWALLVPGIFWLSRRFPLGRERLPLHVGVHLLAVVAAGGLYGAIQTFASEQLIPEDLKLFRYLRGPRGGPDAGREGPREGPPPRELHERGERGERPDWPRERDHVREGGRSRPRDIDTFEISRPEPNATNGSAAASVRPATPPGSAVGPGPGGGPMPMGPRPMGRPDGGWDRGRFRGGPTFFERALFNVTYRWHLHLLTYGMVVGLWHWLAQQTRLRERERQARELSRQLAEARLQALRMQLNPHFLFNTLNGIATMVHRDARAADEMISSLSDFLRLTLGTSNAPESALRSEVEFARRYLDIERARFGERLTVEEDLPGDTLACLVPTLILQPLLENAIRHGIERSESRGTIWISARRDAGHLVLRVADSGPGLQASNGARKGIGLANTRARIRELHGDAGDLRLSERAGGGLEVEIRLPWKVPAA